MKYKAIVKAVFRERPNRFIAHVDVDGRREIVHVKNTGRCRELLQKGATVYLERGDNPLRKTLYDLVAVMKGDTLINMDSQAPNKAVGEWLLKKDIFPDLLNVRAETKHGNSRFDFFVECESRKIFIEVKGVTLEKDGVAAFPDAPSERAVKHIEELIKAKQDGYDVYVLFVVQMKGVKYLIPNETTHPEFAAVLRKAAKSGVNVIAYDCIVTEDEMVIDEPVSVKL